MVSVPPSSAGIAGNRSPFRTSSCGGGVDRNTWPSNPARIPPIVWPTPPKLFLRFATPEAYDRSSDRPANLEQLPVGRRGRLALARPRLLARAVVRFRLAGLEDAKRLLGLALDRADAEWHPLRRVLETVRLGVAPRVGLLEALGLDPHLLALEQAVDARLA